MDLALWLSFATAFAIGMRGFLKHRVLRFFDLGSTVVFGFLAMFCGFFEPGLQISAIRLIVDISLFAIAFASLVARQPFTLQYAPGNVEADVLDRPSFIRANYLTTLVWLIAFAVMAGADGAATFIPAIPVTSAVAAGLLTLAAALAFTWRHRELAQRSTALTR